MYIRRVILENIKGFEHLDFYFDRSENEYAGWTVITGDNGAGKTVLLKAIAMTLLGPSFARTLQPSLRGWVRSGESRGYIGVELVADEPDRFATGRRYERPFWSELVLERTKGGDITLAPDDTRRKSKRGPVNGPWEERSAGWFAAGYGPFRRIRGTSPDAQRLMSGPSRLARFATLFREDATLQECELWLTDLNYKKLEHRAREAQMLDHVISLLNDDLLRNGISVDSVDSEGLWLKDARGDRISLSETSDGYRSSLAMMADILRQLFATYGDPHIFRDGSRVRVDAPGVVLIDEVDAHLHPAWQREIGEWLKERFPQLQFIVTTHSPHICQSADSNGVFHLPPPGSGALPFQLDASQYKTIVSSKTDTILLTPAFGLRHTRSPRAVAAREEHARLVAKQRTKGLTQAELEELGQTRLFVSTDEE
jgi:hypothetical protein